MSELSELRNFVARLCLKVAKRVATDPGWAILSSDIGAPNMRAGLLALRERGVKLASVIDAGACVGDWTRLLLSEYPEARVLAIEPQERHKQALQQLAGARPNVSVSSSLLGPYEATEIDFTVLDDSSGGTGSSVLPERSGVPRHVVRLPMTTLDALVERFAFPPPDLIKLDVQGYELEVLKGASVSLLAAKFVLMEVSVRQYNEGSPLINEVLGWMAERGFVVYDLFDVSRQRDGMLVQVDLLFVRAQSPLLEKNRGAGVSAANSKAARSRRTTRVAP